MKKRALSTTSSTLPSKMKRRKKNRKLVLKLRALLKTRKKAKWHSEGKMNLLSGGLRVLKRALYNL